MSIRSISNSAAQYFVIDKSTRTITAPAGFKNFGVESDENSNRVYFQCPRYVGDNLDLATLNIRVNFQNANKEKDQYIVTDVAIDGENICFSWVLSRKATAYKGSISFIICAVKTNAQGVITNEWNTTLATGAVLSGLEVETPEIPEEVTDVVNQLLDIVNTAKSDMKVATAEGMANIKTAENQAIEAVLNTPNSLMANAIKGSASGEIVAIHDVSPLEHTVNVKVQGGNDVTLIRCGKNLAPINEFTIEGKPAATNSNIGGIYNTVLIKDLSIKNGQSYIISMDKPAELLEPRAFLYNGVLTARTHTATYAELIDNNRGIQVGALEGAIVNSANYEYLAVTTGATSTFEGGIHVSFDINNLQVELGETITEFEPYSRAEYTPSTDGTINVASLAPNMTLFTDTKGVNIECEYNKDSTVVIQELIERITALENQGS